MNLDSITDARDWIDDAERIVVLTGAGISTDSGIPDFRGPEGVWVRDPEAEKLSTIEHYLASPEVRKAAWRARISQAALKASPNAGHLALVALEQRGQLHALITQNIDGLHQQAGHSPDKVIEVHGSTSHTVCWNCKERLPFADTMARLAAGDEDPACLGCGGILKADTILFGERLRPEVIAAANSAAARADLLLAVGSTLQVHPAAGLVPLARGNGARVIIVNRDPTDMDGIADAVLNGSISEVLPMICQVSAVSS